jgi:hypothetical protein
MRHLYRRSGSKILEIIKIPVQGNGGNTTPIELDQSQKKLSNNQRNKSSCYLASDILQQKDKFTMEEETADGKKTDNSC